MTKQEEIENAIVNKQLFEFKLVSPMVSKELEHNARQYAKELMKELSDLGVVIKVNGELPIITKKGNYALIEPLTVL